MDFVGIFEKLETALAFDSETVGSVIQNIEVLKELFALKQSDSTDTTKILNLRKILTVKVADESGSKPFLISIGERAEKLAEAFEQKLKDTKDVLADFEKLAQEYVDADSERKKLDIDENSFAIYLQAKDIKSDFTPQQAVEINEIVSQFHYFKWSDKQEKELRQKLYAKLLPISDGKFIEITDKILKLNRV